MLSALPVGAAPPSDAPAHPQKYPNTAVTGRTLGIFSKKGLGI